MTITMRDLWYLLIIAFLLGNIVKSCVTVSDPQEEITYERFQTV